MQPAFLRRTTTDGHHPELLQQADFLIMDEPFSHLDDKNADKALDLIQKEAAKNGSALILTSLGSDYGWNYDRLVLL